MKALTIILFVCITVARAQIDTGEPIPLPTVNFDLDDTADFEATTSSSVHQTTGAAVGVGPRVVSKVDSIATTQNRKDFCRSTCQYSRFCPSVAQIITRIKNSSQECQDFITNECGEYGPSNVNDVWVCMYEARGTCPNCTLSLLDRYQRLACQSCVDRCLLRPSGYAAPRRIVSANIHSNFARYFGSLRPQRPLTPPYGFRPFYGGMYNYNPLRRPNYGFRPFYGGMYNYNPLRKPNYFSLFQRFPLYRPQLYRRPSFPGRFPYNGLSVGFGNHLAQHSGNFHHRRHRRSALPSYQGSYNTYTTRNHGGGSYGNSGYYTSSNFGINSQGNSGYYGSNSYGGSNQESSYNYYPDSGSSSSSGSSSANTDEYSSSSSSSLNSVDRYGLYSPYSSYQGSYSAYRPSYNPYSSGYSNYYNNNNYYPSYQGSYTTYRN